MYIYVYATIWTIVDSIITQIEYIKRKICIGIMYQARKYKNKKSLVGLYNTYIDPYIIYSVESWGNVTKCHLDPLFILQK